MPTFTRSAMNPNGTWQSDAMDQSEAFNANRADTNNRWNVGRQDARSQSDMALQMLREQLGLQREMYQGGRQDAASSRQMEADRFGKQFEYMGGRDKLADERWGKGFEQDRLDREDERGYRKTMLGRDEQRYKDQQPLNQAQLAIALMQMEREKRKEGIRGTAGEASLYQPVTPEGRDAYNQTLQVTGEPLQAGAAAKAIEHERARESASTLAEEAGVDVKRFANKDQRVFGGDVTDEDMAGITKSLEALAAIYRRSGMPEEEVQIKLRKVLRDNSGLTGSFWSDPVNAGKTQELLQRYGVRQ